MSPASLLQMKKTAFRYNYNEELFSVRRKEFWPLRNAAKVIQQFIPNLCHESDGLILQPSRDPYVPGTCAELLKFKFAEHNSVDFYLEVVREGRGGPGDAGLQLNLLLAVRGRLVVQPQLTNKVVLPGNQDPMKYDRKVIECRWDGDRNTWEFMRERTDKKLPNAQHVYRSVVKSIEDNIQAADIVQYLERCLDDGDLYWADRNEREQVACAKAGRQYRPSPEYHQYLEERKGAQRQLFAHVTEAVGPQAMSYLLQKQAQAAQAPPASQRLPHHPHHHPPHHQYPPPQPHPHSQPYHQGGAFEQEDPRRQQQPYLPAAYPGGGGGEPHPGSSHSHPAYHSHSQHHGSPGADGYGAAFAAAPAAVRQDSPDRPLHHQQDVAEAAASSPPPPMAEVDEPPEISSQEDDAAPHTGNASEDDASYVPCDTANPIFESDHELED